MSKVGLVNARISLVVVFLCSIAFAQYCFAASVYKLGPRDVINITIFAGGEKQVDVNLTVSGQGMVNAPFVGPIQAAGIAISTLENNIQKPLAKDYFVEPQVHVVIKEYLSLQYSISGAVKKPGKYEMQSAATIMDLIAKAGGVVSGRGNVAYILREEDTGSDGNKNNEPIKVNLVKLLDAGDMSYNVALKSGDAVYVPLSKGLKQGESKVYVSGKVKKPGLHDYQPGLSALSVCIMAGGFDEFAAPNRAAIIRMEGEEQKVIKINLEKVVEGKLADIPLQPGDRLYIPESWL
ncbi:MAG: polysaccharide export protein [Desulfobulbaceae bacterium]|nr:polysaccharide export protein [Desulfobulbaceae bacterium]